ncbi:MAG: hypothetical protein ABR500_01265 [Dermatophilaceae bacterium]|nr:hypothetical protein [Intrasporangiaceae bacterium]
MGIDVAFSAANDAAAAEAEVRPGGPLGWPVQVGTRKVGWSRKEAVFEEAGAAFDGFATRGYDGVANMGTLEELLTGVPYDGLDQDPRWGGQVSDDEAPENCGVLCLTDTLRDFLAAAPEGALETIVGSWAETEELASHDGAAQTQADLDDHLTFLQMLRDLAARAHDKGHHLYWYFEM